MSDARQTATASATDPSPRPIVFFDGVCAMCNASVSLLLRADRRGVFLFAPIQGSTARARLPRLSADPRDWSLIYVDEAGVHEQSDAALRISRRLGGWWGVLALARFIPRWLRDPAYRLIARNRYRWFGRHDACRVPREEERARFLP